MEGYIGTDIFSAIFDAIESPPSFEDIIAEPPLDEIDIDTTEAVSSAVASIFRDIFEDEAGDIVDVGQYGGGGVTGVTEIFGQRSSPSMFGTGGVKLREGTRSSGALYDDSPYSTPADSSFYGGYSTGGSSSGPYLGVLED